MRRFHEIDYRISLLDDADQWDDESEKDNWDGCCEDPYEEEEQEREWCD